MSKRQGSSSTFGTALKIGGIVGLSCFGVPFLVGAVVKAIRGDKGEELESTPEATKPKATQPKSKKAAKRKTGKVAPKKVLRIPVPKRAPRKPARASRSR